MTDRIEEFELDGIHYACEIKQLSEGSIRYLMQLKRYGSNSGYLFCFKDDMILSQAQDLDDDWEEVE